MSSSFSKMLRRASAVALAPGLLASAFAPASMSTVSRVRSAAQSTSPLFAAPPTRYMLQYKYVPDVLEKRGPHREGHIGLAQGMVEAGTCVSGGPTVSDGVPDGGECRRRRGNLGEARAECDRRSPSPLSKHVGTSVRPRGCDSFLRVRHQGRRGEVCGGRSVRVARDRDGALHRRVERGRGRQLASCVASCLSWSGVSQTFTRANERRTDAGITLNSAPRSLQGSQRKRRRWCRSFSRDCFTKFYFSTFPS